MPAVALRDGARLEIDIEGRGPALVLISGLGGTSGFWGPLIAALGPTVQTVRFDQRGIGRGERGRLAVTIRSLAEDTWEIIDTLGIATPVLCGHSTGGAIVQEMELARPGVARGIVLSGSWAGPDPFMARMFGLRLDLLEHVPGRYAEFAALLGSPPRWLLANPHVVEQAATQSPNALEVTIIAERIQALLAHDCRDRLCRITTPALVLSAMDDMIVPNYLQEELASLLTGPQFEVLDHGGHFFPVTRSTDTARILLGWMEALDHF